MSTALSSRFHGVAAEELVRRASESDSLPVWRTAHARSRLDADEVLAERVNEFHRDWLFQIYLATVLVTAVDDGITAETANTQLSTPVGRVDQHDPFRRVLDGVLNPFLQTEHPEDGEDLEPVGRDPDVAERDDDDLDARNRRLRAELEQLLSQPEVLEHLGAAVSEIWNPDAESWSTWLADSIHETLAEAAHEAALAIAPTRASEGSTRLDLERGLENDNARGTEAWITETAIGGAGVAQAIASAYVEDPRSFFRAFEFALQPRDRERASVDLDRTMMLASTDATIGRAVTLVGEAQRHDERERALSELSLLLQRGSVAPTHAFLSSLNQRILTGAAALEAAGILHDVVTFWMALEERTGIALDLRVFCTLLPHMQELAHGRRAEEVSDFLVQQAGQPLTLPEQIGALTSLLWPREHELRRRSLSSWSPFRSPGFTDPALVRELVLPEVLEEVDLSNPDWRGRLFDSLARTGVVRLRASVEDVPSLQNEIAKLIATPVDTAFLQFFPSVEQLTRHGDSLVVTLVLRGVV